MRKLIWWLVKDHFLKAQFKPVGFEQLELAFLDSDSKKFFKFSEKMALPLERWAHLNKYLALYERGLSGEAMDELLDAIEVAIEDGLKDPKKKSAARIGAIVHQMRWRKGMIVPPELIYNILAVQLVREDETIEAFDNDIQMQKVEQLKKEVAKYGCSFFLQFRELRKLYDFSTMSESEWEQYWTDCQLEQKAIQEAIKILSAKSLFANN